MNFDWINIKIGFRKLYTAYKKNIIDKLHYEFY